MTGRIDFGRSTQDQVPCFVAIMEILHAEPTASAFARLLRKELLADDYVQLAHLFEEISVLTLHRHIAEELLFDAFGFDMYWDELREDVLRVRRTTGNDKFCENFEIAAARAQDYRNDRPPKRRWHHRPEGDEPPGAPGDKDRPPPGLVASPLADKPQKSPTSQEPSVRQT